MILSMLLAPWSLLNNQEVALLHKWFQPVVVKETSSPAPCLISFYNLLSVESTTCLPYSFCFPLFSARSACVSKFVLITEETTGWLNWMSRSVTQYTIGLTLRAGVERWNSRNLCSILMCNPYLKCAISGKLRLVRKCFPNVDWESTRITRHARQTQVNKQLKVNKQL